jgi:hypothetical protein
LTSIKHKSSAHARLHDDLLSGEECLMFPPVIPAAPYLLSRVLVRLALPAVLLFTVLTLFARAQRSDTSLLTTLLLPPSDCAAPCFLGIRPGLTTVNAGLDQLRTRAPVQSVSLVSPMPGMSPVSDTYEVAFLQPSGSLRVTRMQFVTEPRSGVIEGILLSDMGITLADVYVTFGQPASLILDDRLHLGLVTYVGFYPQYQLYIQAVFAICSPNISSLWTQHQSVLIGIESERRFAQELSFYAEELQPSNGAWSQRLHDSRRQVCV